MTEPVFYGYPGQVWAVVLASLNYLAEVLAAATQPFDTLPVAEVVLQTALNGLACINASRTALLWQSETSTMIAIEALPISLSPTDLAFFENRLTAMQAAGPALLNQCPAMNLSGVAKALASGNPAIPDPGILEFFQAFEYEPAPAGLTSNNLPASATAFATAFADLAAKIAVLQGTNLNYLYDLPNRFALEAVSYAELIGNFTTFSEGPASVLWNQLFTLPTMECHADLLSGAPSTLAAQQDQLLRFLIITAIQQLCTFILTVARPVQQNISQATLLTGDSLMDVANRALNNFEQWSAIASLNNLLPPYVGMGMGPNIATYGAKLLLPVPGGPTGPGVTPSYVFNFLGVDLYFGPINGDFPAWSGDFQLIAGIPNLRWALGRRMQTTLGTLIYHSDYGSQIPPEVGQVADDQTAGLIAGYGRACLLTDPRVAAVVSATATLLSNFSVAFTGSIQPAGFTSVPVVVNEVINPTINPVALR